MGSYGLLLPDRTLPQYLKPGTLRHYCTYIHLGIQTSVHHTEAIASCHYKQLFNSISSLMDYDKLKQVLPKQPTKWTVADTETWLNFIGLPAVIPVFTQCSIDGSIIQSLTEADLREEMLIKSNITIKKLMSWIKVGIKEYQDYLSKETHNGFKGNSTIQIQDKQMKPQKQPSSLSHTQHHHKENDKKQTIENKNDKIELIIKQEEIEDTVAYHIGPEGAKIGRHTSNQVLILDEAVSRYHSEIVCQDKKFFIRDIGSSTGTFVKLTDKLKLEEGMLFEMGSYTFLIEQIVGNKLSIQIIEGPDAPLTLDVIDVEKKISIGRKASNKISFPDDPHMSNTHACIFLIQNDLYIEDLGATNGTWRRLSPEATCSQFYPISNGDFFKVSSNCTYSCKILNCQKAQRPQLKNCMKCQTVEKDCVLMPCKHNCVCMSCSQALSQCPFCKIKVEERLKIYG